MNNTDESFNTDLSSESNDEGIETTLVTRSKNDGVRNELWIKMRNTEYGIKGWKACAVETLGLTLMLAGVFFVAIHGKDAGSSAASFISKSTFR